LRPALSRVTASHQQRCTHYHAAVLTVLPVAGDRRTTLHCSTCDELPHQCARIPVDGVQRAVVAANVHCTTTTTHISTIQSHTGGGDTAPRASTSAAPGYTHTPVPSAATAGDDSTGPRVSNRHASHTFGPLGPCRVDLHTQHSDGTSDSGPSSRRCAVPPALLRTVRCGRRHAPGTATEENPTQCSQR
jgi:hypothetical protein